MTGKTFVLVPRDEFEIFTRTALPEFPSANACGNFPAIEASRISLARKLIGLREAVGLSQKDLAAEAGGRVETLNRIEKVKVTADTTTIVKIDKALTKAEKAKR